MERICEGVILSKKGFGEGHLSINFLDSEYGKIRLTAFGAGLETGKRRAGISSGSFIQGLVKSKDDRNILSDIKPLLSIDNIREDLKPMGFSFFVLEILDMMVLEGDLFPYYDDLLKCFELFDDSLDEKYILFFLAKFLSGEGWIYSLDRLRPTTRRFVEDAQTHDMDFLKGIHISEPRKKELAYFCAAAVKNAKNRLPHSTELLRFDCS